MKIYVFLKFRSSVAQFNGLNHGKIVVILPYPSLGQAFQAAALRAWLDFKQFTRRGLKQSIKL